MATFVTALLALVASGPPHPALIAGMRHALLLALTWLLRVKGA